MAGLKKIFPFIIKVQHHDKQLDLRTLLKYAFCTMNPYLKDFENPKIQREGTNVLDLITYFMKPDCLIKRILEKEIQI